ncbi:alpha/beta hydrolase [Streptomyces avermitilis]|uniref:Family S33 peptidase n=2 Tax=Streptomyces avermitilis TaxID=33903 RepID=Q82NP5_STRAW|nr:MULTISPECIES: alpha/beta hydrolase [Streptomyces]KUN55304.1 alpha/beta hydrolase [Streptomyces avermitilis]MYS96888.1 alpha/beta fold hydrolase [Streptomyces sp. SID5469]OOV26595.1 alpha/beta hydrolase [Streptomyces avermitilis]BAC68966.1 putative family S33 peptidase [Streptomyces avermitilis MA-4680 = NBRC 14893]BBJ48901.1 hydrolase [Streptomyces avermitilis]
MPNFSAPDGTELAYHTRGEGEPLVVLPGGAMRASAYLGDLGGLGARRRLVLLDLRGTGDSAEPADPATYRCDRLVDDVEALRVHLGLERMDVLAHSAGGNLAMLYAARYPERIARLALITATPWAVGMGVRGEDRLAAARLRKGEPWFEAAFPAFEAWLAESGDWDPVFEPFFYGRWDDAARAHAAGGEEQTNDEAGDRYGSAGAYDPPATRAALAGLTAPVLVYAGELDGGPRPELARRVADVFPAAEFAVQPGGGHYPWLDDPGWFTARVEAFLAR